MEKFYRGIVLSSLAIGLLVATVFPLGAQSPIAAEKSIVGAGWHPWYEIKVDPENAKALIVCGTKWDAERNAALGFVYASADGGLSWRPVLEDRNSTWVTEQSCAFGTKHRAYFLSSSSKVIDGSTHHELGTTRLYVSPDGGQQWSETNRTGWADWSTSAVSSSSGRLYTFFNANTTIQEFKQLGSNVGLLVFAPDGKKLFGPLFNPGIQELDYRGIYPSYATTLKSGGVVALYHAFAPGGQEEDLGLIRAGASLDPSLEFTVIAHSAITKDCPLLDKGALAYDSEQNRLFVLFGDGCKNRRLRLTSSTDEGRTWAAPKDVLSSQSPGPVVSDPSLAVAPGGRLGLLWQEDRGSGRWLFSYFHGDNLLGAPVVLSAGIDKLVFSNDTLTTWIGQANEHYGSNPNGATDASASLNLFAMFNNVWRSSSLSLVDGKLLAVWPEGKDNGMHLYSSILDDAGTAVAPASMNPRLSGKTDVTEQSVILYGGAQSFDRARATLNVCLLLGNRGDRPLEIPIELRVEDLRSGYGSISALNATNGATGSGATWDISYAVTGNQIPPRSSSNPFCLSFRLNIPKRGVPPQAAADLLKLKMRVFASAAPHTSMP